MNNENKMYTKAQYKCGVCGEIYDSIQDRMNCEMKCLKKQEQEAKAAADAKKKAEQNARRTEVTKALENAYTLLSKYIKDYGSYEYNGNLKDLDMSAMNHFPSKLWHYFWF